LALAGCSGDDDGDGAATDEPNGTTPDDGSDQNEQETFSTFVSVPSTQYLFFSRMENEFERYNENNPLTGSFVSADGNQSQQVSDIRDGIQQDPDFLCVTPITVEGANPALEEAKEAGIPIINIDREVVGVDVTSWIEFDMVQAAKDSVSLAYDFAQEIEDKDTYNFVEIKGRAGTSSVRDRTQGWGEFLDEHDDVTELASQNANWSTSEALSVTEDIITQHEDDIDAIFAHNDLMAQGVRQAVESSNLSVDSIPITGQDGIPSWAMEIYEHNNFGTAAFTNERQMRQALDIGMAVARGEDVTDHKITEHLMLTSDNARDYLLNNFGDEYDESDF